MSALPSEIAVFESSDGEFGYRLSRRPFRSTLVCLGSLILFVGAFFAAGPIIGAKSLSIPINAFPVLFLELFCFPVGALLVFWGLQMLVGHTQITIRSDRLQIVDKCGPLGLPRRIPLRNIRAFRVEPSGADASIDANEAPHGSWFNLMADLLNGTSKTICLWYPRDWLMPLAEDLGRRCQQRVARATSDIAAPFRVVEGAGESPSVPGCLIWAFAGLFGLIGAVVLLLGLGFGGWYVYRAIGMQATNGRVVNWESDVDGDQSFTVAEYQVNGQTFRAKGMVAFSPPAHSIGDSVRILYRPDRPADSMIDSFVERWLFPLGSCFVGSVFIAICAGIWYVRRKWTLSVSA
jgi:hypothetical protein